MRVYERSGVTVDQCTECRGIFLDRGELEKLFEAEANFNSRQTAQGPPAAPQPGGYAPPPGGGYPAPQAPGYPPQPAGYPAPAPAYGQHGGQYGHHGHYRKKKHKSFLNELFD
jgi:Zn-finger nucleic acid-binding protein